MGRGAVTATLTAAMLTFFNWGCTSQNIIQKTEPKRGDSTIVLQSNGQAFAERPKAKRLEKDSIPIPIEKQIEGSFYYPYKSDATLFDTSNAKLKYYFRRDWMKDEDKINPFGLSDSAFAAYPPEGQKDLKGRWEIAKQKLRIAFMSEKGATPENAFEMHPPQERAAMVDAWEKEKPVPWIEKLQHVPQH